MRDAFSIPHDLRILEEVFGVQAGAYRRSNAYWKAQSIAGIYRELSEVYQSAAGKHAIPLA